MWYWRIQSEGQMQLSFNDMKGGRGCFCVVFGQNVFTLRVLIWGTIRMMGRRFRHCFSGPSITSYLSYWRPIQIRPASEWIAWRVCYTYSWSYWQASCAGTANFVQQFFLFRYLFWFEGYKVKGWSFQWSDCCTHWKSACWCLDMRVCGGRGRGGMGGVRGEGSQPKMIWKVPLSLQCQMKELV